MQLLELRHLASYLPYKLKVIEDGKQKVMNAYSGHSTYWVGVEFVIKQKGAIKPILRPLSDLAKEIECNGKRFVPNDILFPVNEYFNEFDRKVAVYSLQNEAALDCCCTYYAVVQKLHEWHFDTFGLIENNLAIDINILKTIKL